MDTRRLRSFLTLAETLHFGRAAERAGISQPTLSQHVRRLEQELEVELFERTSRHVHLTDAGAALVSGARRVIADVERARRECRDAAAGRAGTLTVASNGSVLNTIVPSIIARLRRERPGLAIEVAAMDSAAELTALQDGEVDIAVMRYPQPLPGMEMRALIEEPMVAAVPAGHPLAPERPIAVEQLRDERFVLWPRSSSEGFRDQVEAMCRAAGFSPRVAMEGADIETQLGLVAAGLGVSIQPASYSALGRDGVRFLAFPEDAPRSTVTLVWPTFAAGPSTRAFLAAAEEVAGAHGPVLRVGPYAGDRSGDG